MGATGAAKSATQRDIRAALRLYRAACLRSQMRRLCDRIAALRSSREQFEEAGRGRYGSPDVRTSSSSVRSTSPFIGEFRSATRRTRRAAPRAGGTDRRRAHARKRPSPAFRPARSAPSGRRPSAKRSSGCRRSPGPSGDLPTCISIAPRRVRHWRRLTPSTAVRILFARQAPRSRNVEQAEPFDFAGRPFDAQRSGSAISLRPSI